MNFYFSFLINSSNLSILLLNCLCIIAAVNVAVPTPDNMYPPHTKRMLFNLPNADCPNMAYPLLVNAFETITIASKGSTPSENVVFTKLKKIIANNSTIAIPKLFDLV